MTMPAQNSPVTQDQVNQSLNLKSFPGAKPGKNWHKGPDGGGVFEPWSMSYGYPDGFPTYGSVSVNGAEVHIYYLNDAYAAPIILQKGQTPETYNFPPKSKTATVEGQTY